MIPLIIVACYLALLLGLGLLSSRAFKGTASDYFLASRGIGSFLLVMSLFGTSMTAFALVGSTGESFVTGIGVFGKLASSSAIVHSLCFFVIGVRLWSIGSRNGYLTQIQFFRDRFESDKLGLLLFPIIVGLVIPYLLIGILGGGTTIVNMSIGAFPNTFENGSVPFWLGSGAICLVVLVYVFFGGIRGTAWANAFQTMVFVVLGVVTFGVIADKLGGLKNATQMVAESNPSKLQRAVHPDDQSRYEEARLAYENFQVELANWMALPDGPSKPPRPADVSPPKRPQDLSKLVFFTYLLIPFSIGMFPHIFQHWLTAKSGRSFKVAVVAQPLLIIVLWVPCVLIGTWATSAVVNGEPVIPAGFSNPNAVLPFIVNKLTGDLLGGLLMAGILAAIMSSLDSQFLCLGSIFTNDIYLHYFGHREFSEKQRVVLGRLFVVAVVLISYLLAVWLQGRRSIFTLGMWCFSGFVALVPLVLASIYWRRVTKAGAYAAIGAAAVCWLWLFANSDYGANRAYLFLGMLPVATMTIVSTVVLVAVSLMTEPPSQKTLAKFFPPSS